MIIIWNVIHLKQWRGIDFQKGLVNNGIEIERNLKIIIRFYKDVSCVLEPDENTYIIGLRIKIRKIFNFRKNSV